MEQTWFGGLITPTTSSTRVTMELSATSPSTTTNTWNSSKATLRSTNPTLDLFYSACFPLVPTRAKGRVPPAFKSNLR